MKKTFFFLIVVLVVSFLIFEAKTAQGGVTLNFDFQGVSEVYVKFIYEFDSRMSEKVKQYSFLGEYRVQILEGKGRRIYQNNSMEEEIVIVVLVNKEKNPFIWVRVRDLDSEENIKEAAKEFCDETILKLKELDKKKERKTNI